MLLKFFYNFDLKNDLLIKFRSQMLIFSTPIYGDRKSPKTLFNAIFDISEASL